MKEIITNSFSETQKEAKNFIRQILINSQKRERALIIALEGDLGSGKTTFAQGLAKGLGVKEQITSPTFVLIKRHPLKFQDSRFKFQEFYHIDCYRIEKFWQLQELGFEEIINNPQNIVAIEWPEKISEILPRGAIKIKFEFINEDKRKIILNRK